MDVSIPSRRVGDPSLLLLLTARNRCFHPLKAGRRLDFKQQFARDRPVSIPSRRVGDDFFPANNTPQLRVSIPSRRVGDFGGLLPMRGEARVSIPSRRVGDKATPPHIRPMHCFHPLKAGRRPCSCRWMSFSCCCFHPLKAGRRLDLLPFTQKHETRFHPLKAGRRRGV